jgi:hypothetical protein
MFMRCVMRARASDSEGRPPLAAGGGGCAPGSSQRKEKENNYLETKTYLFLSFFRTALILLTNFYAIVAYES